MTASEPATSVGALPPLSRDAGEVGPRGAALAGLACCALGLSMHVREGLYHPEAMLLLTVSVGLLLLAVFRGGAGPEDTPPANLRRDRWIAAGVLFGLLALALRWPSTESTWGGTWPLARAGFFVVYGLAGLCVLRIGWGRTRDHGRAGGYGWPVAGVVVLFLAGGSMSLLLNRYPFIDVFTITQEACAGLLAGQNPFTLHFTDVYKGTSPTYPPEFLQDGKITSGWLYPPLPLLLSLTGYVTTGDFRWAHLAAVAGTGVLVYACGSGRRAALAAAMLLMMPRIFYVVDMGWTEAWTGLLLAATVWTALRRRAWVFVPLGLLLASKQHLVLLLPLVPLLGLTGRDLWRQVAGAVGVAVAVTAPLALWDPYAFIQSNLLLRLGVPLRSDSVSYLAMLNQVIYGPSTVSAKFPAMLGVWPGLAAYGAAAWLAWRRVPRTPAGFALASALVLTAFFAFGVQAFVNYYYVCMVGLCLALAASSQGRGDEVEAGSRVDQPGLA